MADKRTDPVSRGWPQTVAEEAEAEYFARKYGLPADQLSVRAKIEAAARRLMD